MQYRILLPILLLIWGFVSCNDEDLITAPKSQLEFSADTISFDTLFSGIGSTTLQLKVYNKSSDRILIREIGLGKSDQSDFRLNINGIATNFLQNVELRAKDSLFLFVELTPEKTNRDLPVLIKDSILFRLGDQTKDVKLTAWSQDVHLVKDQVLSTQKWTANRPYLVFGKLVVAENEILSLDPGTSIYFHRDAGMEVRGTLMVNGSLEAPVLLQGDRLEDLYEDVPGQWQGIQFLQGSYGNHVKHMKLKNAKYALVFEGASPDQPIDVGLSHTEIRNINGVGIALKNGTLTGNNLLLANCGQQLLKAEGETNIEIFQSTLANYWGLSFRSEPAVEINLSGTESSRIQFGNCIVDGNLNTELMLNGENAQFRFEHCLVRDASGSNSNTEVFLNCLFNESPLFVDPSLFDFRLMSDSPAINAGSSTIATQYPIDLVGNERTVDEAPDIGAIEFFEE